MPKHENISRRAWLKGMVVLSATLASGAAEAKTTKAAVHYQDHPNGGRSCQMCKFFISAAGGHSGIMGGGMMGHHMMGAGACQLVEGRISPTGYCDLYTPRS